MSTIDTTASTNRTTISIYRMAATAMFMAMNIVLSSFSIPVPGGHLYLCDIGICTAGILLDPFSAFIAGGMGSFLGDFFFYPAPMFVSLAAHGLQAVTISLCTRHVFPKRKVFGSCLGVSAGAVIMVTGYTLGRAFIYSTPEYAVIKLPFEILQAAIGAVTSLLLCFRFRLSDFYRKLSHLS